jgi:hypothetical protein
VVANYNCTAGTNIRNVAVTKECTPAHSIGYGTQAHTIAMPTIGIEMNFLEEYCVDALSASFAEDGG